jgi:phosphatidylserine decarboxylase
MSHLSAAHLEATIKVLEHTVDSAATNHQHDPQTTLLAPASHEVSHSILKGIFARDYIEKMEATWHSESLSIVSTGPLSADAAF